LGPKYWHPLANISAINHLVLLMFKFIPGMPVRVQHAPANVQAVNILPAQRIAKLGIMLLAQQIYQLRTILPAQRIYQLCTILPA